MRPTHRHRRLLVERAAYASWTRAAGCQPVSLSMSANSVASPATFGIARACACCKSRLPARDFLTAGLVGGREADWAMDFMKDSASRIKSRVQVTTDGDKAYLEAVGRRVRHGFAITPCYRKSRLTVYRRTASLGRRPFFWPS